MIKLSEKLWDSKIKDDSEMRMVKSVLALGAKPYITFKKGELPPSLKEYRFDADSLSSEVQEEEKEKMSVRSRNTYSSYAASSDSEGGSPGMWARLRSPKGTSAASFEKRPTPGG